MGNLKDISTARMVRITEAWLDPARDRPTIEALPSGPTLIGKIEAAHAGLLSTQKKDLSTSKELATLSDKQAVADKRHDRKIRASWFVLTGFAEAADDPKDAEAILAARDELLPNGLSATKESYHDEAGAVELTDARISEKTRALLKKLPVPGGKLWNVAEAWFEAGRELGQLEDQKEKLTIAVGATGPSKMDALKARNFWIKVARHVETTLELESASEQIVSAILGPLHAAEKETTRRVPSSELLGNDAAVQPAAPA
ncbi:hypothetical protein [Polyangium jinanense]|uniref:Uncharacterized protein n=1 Tax=Polyangium jinanense TaxID=2829994 RepID=A0A9X3XBJ7_9BACT|nr:hypothetical protein [Polyangium jinanense]MDC3959319.1 hypothetical protein [Polyangium jinanense]MDC3985728.1 hypothetical protein [Polyangium jinanense]